jgi:hypothetical protein
MHAQIDSLSQAFQPKISGMAAVVTSYIEARQLDNQPLCVGVINRRPFHLLSYLFLFRSRLESIF